MRSIEKHEKNHLFMGDFSVDNYLLFLGNFASICEALDYAAQGQSGINFYNSSGNLTESLGYGALRERAIAMAGRLAARSVHPAGLGVRIIAPVMGMK